MIQYIGTFDFFYRCTFVICISVSQCKIVFGVSIVTAVNFKFAIPGFLTMCWCHKEKLIPNQCWDLKMKKMLLTLLTVEINSTEFLQKQYQCPRQCDSGQIVGSFFFKFKGVIHVILFVCVGSITAVTVT